MLSALRELDLEQSLGLRPDYPPVAVEMSRSGLVLVRIKRRGRRVPPQLEAHAERPLPERAMGSSIFRPNLGATEELQRRVKEAFEASGTRPGRLSLVLPDNLAKTSLLALPERPGSAKHLSELVRFKLRRAVPFRLEDAVLSFQVLPGEGLGVTVLVAVMLRAVVEQSERLIESVGARVGLVDLCTPNLFNLCRPRITEKTS